MSDAAQRIISLYDDKAEGWIADRSRTLGLGGPVMNEKMALDLFAQALPRGGAVLDVGCGYGWPWGAALLQRGFRVTGVDTSPRLIAHAAETLTDGEWICDDMRRFDLGRTFDGLLVWFSLFHLTPDDQRAALVRILAHAAPRATLLMTAGWGEGGHCRRMARRTALSRQSGRRRLRCDPDPGGVSDPPLGRGGRRRAWNPYPSGATRLTRR